MDFRVNIFFLFFFINKQVILERGLDFFIIYIPISLISLDDLRGIIGSFAITPIINILWVSIALFCWTTERGGESVIA
jgi:hypothetical protein